MSFLQNFLSPPQRRVGFLHIEFTFNIIGNASAQQVLLSARGQIFSMIQNSWGRFEDKEELFKALAKSRHYEFLKTALIYTGMDETVELMITGMGGKLIDYYKGDLPSTKQAEDDVRTIIEALKDPKKTIRETRRGDIMVR